MSKIVTVDGLERHAIHRDPTGIECDSCGKIYRKKIKDDSYRNPHIREDAKEAGWVFVNGKDYCDECSKEQ